MSITVDEFRRLCKFQEKGFKIYCNGDRVGIVYDAAMAESCRVWVSGFHDYPANLEDDWEVRHEADIDWRSNTNFILPTEDKKVRRVDKFYWEGGDNRLRVERWHMRLSAKGTWIEHLQISEWTVPIEFEKELRAEAKMFPVSSSHYSKHGKLIGRIKGE